MQHSAKRGRPALYDWDYLIERSLKHTEEHDFVQGENFLCTPDSFASLVRRTARVRHLDAGVSIDGDHVYFIFLPERKRS